MGADFIFWAITMPTDKNPDWDAGIKFIHNDEHLSSIIKKSLLSDLKEVKEAWEGKRRDTDKWDLCHLTIMVSGGMSNGESPTDIGDKINDLSDAGVLEACGFDQDIVDYKSILYKVLKGNKEILPRLMGLDESLDKIIMEEFKCSSKAGSRKKSIS